MRALVFMDRSSSCMAPLDREYAIATLPLVSKPLIFYTIEDLVRAGITELVMVVADHAGRVERLLGDGKRWGARFRFVLGRGDERPSAIWPRLRLGEDQPLLVLRGDLLRSPAAGAFMVVARAEVGAALVGLTDDPRGALILLRPGHRDPASLLDILAVEYPRLPADVRTLTLGAEVRPLESLRSYHQACLDLVSGAITGLEASGVELALGLSVGLRAHVSPRSLKQGRAYVGENSRVHPEAELLGNVMIARDVVIDRAVLLRDCVILPHSYVGEMLEVHEAIVAGDTLIRVDTGVVLTISDAFLLGRLRGGGARDAGPPPVRDRLIGLLLLLLSLPLWPLAFFTASLADAGTRTLVGQQADAGAQTELGGLLRCQLLLGNRVDSVVSGVEKGFIGRRLATPIPVLSYLPMVWALVSGDLRLMGVSPLTPGEAASRTEDWQHVRDEAPVGLLGPTQLMLGPNAPLDERLMSDAFYIGQRGWRRHLQLLADALRMLLSARAWRIR